MSAAIADVLLLVTDPQLRRKCAVWGVKEVSTSSGAKREPYGALPASWALEDQLLGGLRRRLHFAGQWPDGDGQQSTVRDVQHPVLGGQGRVEQPDRSHGAVQGAAQCAGADPYLFPGMYWRARSSTRPANMLDRDCWAAVPTIMPLTAPRPEGSALVTRTGPLR